MGRMITFESLRFNYVEQLDLTFSHILYRLFVGSSHFDYLLCLPTHANKIGTSPLSCKNFYTFPVSYINSFVVHSHSLKKGTFLLIC